MKPILRSVGLLLLCGALIAPAADAQSRNNTGRASRSTTQQTRPGNMGQAPAQRPTTSNQSSRPGAQPGVSNNNNRPGVQPGGNNNRPGAQPGAQPGGNNNRPTKQPGSMPGAQPPSFGGQRPGYQPAPPPPSHGPGYHGPSHPGGYRPPVAWSRPAPPPSWRPPSAWQSFNTILGIALGASISSTVNSLMHNGYTVSSYGNNTVYVSNVPMLNMLWPNAVLYYNNLGGLCGSQFIYSTAFYDMSRYNSTYAMLVNTYGSPYSIQNTASGIQANWWGLNNQFITLSFMPQYGATGGVYYYTTLSFGN